MLTNDNSCQDNPTQLVNPRLRLKLPKKRLYRTNNLAQTLRANGKAFEWFTKNSIKIDLPIKTSAERKRTVFVTGALTCYKVRLDVWHFVNGGDFSYWELQENNGHSLLFHLVALGILPSSYLPAPSKRLPYAD